MSFEVRNVTDFVGVRKMTENEWRIQKGRNVEERRENADARFMFIVKMAVVWFANLKRGKSVLN